MQPDEKSEKVSAAAAMFDINHVEMAAEAALPSRSNPHNLVWELTLSANSKYNAASRTASVDPPLVFRAGPNITSSEARGMLMTSAQSLFESSISQGWSNGHTYLGDLFYAFGSAQQAEYEAVNAAHGRSKGLDMMNSTTHDLMYVIIN